MTDHWSDVFVDLLRSAFPQDVGARPIYLSTPAELGDDWALTGTSAYTSAWLDWHTRPQLEAAGRWQGPGFAVVVCRPDFIDSDLPATLGRLTHEIAHCIVASRSSSERILSDSAPETGPGLAAKHMLPAESERLFRLADFPRWLSHEADFIRCALHLHHRLWSRGQWTTPAAMFVAGRGYGLSDGMEYRQRLIDELKTEIDTPIVELLATPAPEGFTDLWKRDTQSLVVHRE